MNTYAPYRIVTELYPKKARWNWRAALWMTAACVLWPVIFLFVWVAL